MIITKGISAHPSKLDILGGPYDEAAHRPESRFCLMKVSYEVVL